MEPVLQQMREQHRIVEKQKDFFREPDKYAMASVFVGAPFHPSIVNEYSGIYHYIHATSRIFEHPDSFYPEKVLRDAIVANMINKGELKTDKEIDKRLKNFSADKHKYFINVLEEHMRKQVSEMIMHIGSRSPVDIGKLKGIVISRYGNENYRQAFIEEVLMNFPTATYYIEGKEVPEYLQQREVGFLKDLDRVSKTFDPIKTGKVTVEFYRKVLSRFIEYKSDFDGDRLVTELDAVRPENVNEYDAEQLALLREISAKATSGTPLEDLLPEIRTFWGSTLLRRFNYFVIEPTSEEDVFGSRIGGRVVPTKNKPIKFEEIGGYKEEKEYLMNIAEALNTPDKVKEINMILLSGPPGTGKTSSVRAFVSSLPPNAKMIAYDRGNFMREYYISSHIADRYPGLAFIGVIDDIDMIAVDRNRGGGVLDVFMDLDSTAYHPPNLTVLATTNRPEVLDSAMLRPGRTRKVLTFDIPNMSDRKEIIGIYAGKAGIDVDVSEVARKTEKFTGDDIRAVFSEIKISKKSPQEAIEHAIEDIALHKGFIKKRKSAKKDDDSQAQLDVS